MATTWKLYLYEPDRPAADRISGDAFDEIDRIEELLSNYRETSELSRINRDAARGPVVTDPETFRFLVEAQHWSAVSDGAFDMTVGPLMKTWGFYRKAGRIPPSSELDLLRSQIGWRHVQLDASERSVRFAAAGVELDPGGIGKGFAVDAVLKLLRAAGVRRAMVSAGSSTIGTIGAPPGKVGWPVIVHNPRSHEAVSTVLLRDTTLSTANCAEKNFTLAGHLYCHIMNPQTLRPVEGVLQVTVIDPSATASDALSNVLFVQPIGKTVALLGKLPDDRALLVTGREDRRVCTAIRWKPSIAATFCERKRVDE